MRHSFIDRYSRLDSPIHRLPATAKLAAAVLLLGGIVATPVALGGFFAAAFVVLLGVAVASRIPPGFLVRRMLFLEMFVLGITILSIFQRNGPAIVAALVIKSSLCLLTIVLFSNTTPFSDLLAVMRKGSIPGLVITTFALFYRYLFVLVDETERMQRARISRTFVARRSLVWRSYAVLIGQLFVRSTERAERIYAAMCARGWR